MLMHETKTIRAMTNRFVSWLMRGRLGINSSSHNSTGSARGFSRLSWQSFAQFREKNHSQKQCRAHRNSIQRCTLKQLTVAMKFPAALVPAVQLQFRSWQTSWRTKAAQHATYCRILASPHDTMNCTVLQQLNPARWHTISSVSQADFSDSP